MSVVTAQKALQHCKLVKHDGKSTPDGVKYLQAAHNYATVHKMIVGTNRMLLNKHDLVDDGYIDLFQTDTGELQPISGYEPKHNNNGCLFIRTGSKDGGFIGINVVNKGQHRDKCSHITFFRKLQMKNLNTLMCETPDGYNYVYRLTENQRSLMENNDRYKNCYDETLEKLFGSDISATYKCRRFLISGAYIDKCPTIDFDKWEETYEYPQKIYRISNDTAPIFLPDVLFQEIMTKMRIWADKKDGLLPHYYDHNAVTIELHDADIWEFIHLRRERVSMRENLKILQDKHEKIWDSLCRTKMMTYLFRNKLSKIYCLNDLLLESYLDKPSIPIDSDPQLEKLLLEYKLSYDGLTDALVQSRRMIKKISDAHKIAMPKAESLLGTFATSQKNILWKKYYDGWIRLKYVYSASEKEPSEGESLVMNVLDKIATDKRWKFYYFYNYRGFVCKNINLLSYDFFCILVFKNKLFMFVIEYDGAQHFKNNPKYNNLDETHKHDILKQYYLSQLNVHLLRLADDSDIKYDIDNFMKQIQHTDKYVVVNRMESDTKLFTDKSEHKGLITFHMYHESWGFNGFPSYYRTPDLVFGNEKNDRLYEKLVRLRKLYKYNDVIREMLAHQWDARRIQMYELEKSKNKVPIDEHNIDSPKEPPNSRNKKRANPRDVVSLFATKPIVTEPIVTKSIVTKPIVTKPIVTKPIVTEPIVTKPTATKRVRRNVVTLDNS